MNELELIKKFAESWNKLEISCVEDYVAEDLTAFSQSLKKNTAHSKNEFIEQIANSMFEIRKAGVKEKVYAEIGFCSQEMVETIALYSKIQNAVSLPRIELDKPCIILAQRTKENLISVVFAEVEGELIKSIFTCGLKIPSPANAVRTGEYPGFTPLTRDEEQELAQIEESTVRRHLIWIDNEHHEYLRVTKEDLKELNVWREISSFSFSSENYCYLEEDCDAATFLEAAEEADWSITFEHEYFPDFPKGEFMGEKIGDFEEDPRCYWCQEEGETDCYCPKMICPVCGDEAACGGEISVSNFSCKHLLAGWENEEFICSSLKVPDRISIKSVDKYEWHEKELAAAFGDSLPLFNCFREGSGNEQSTEFWDVLSELMPGIQSDSFSDDRETCWNATMFFAEVPGQVIKETEQHLRKVKKGYQDLRKLIPEKKM